MFRTVLNSIAANWAALPDSTLHRQTLALNLYSWSMLWCIFHLHVSCFDTNCWRTKTQLQHPSCTIQDCCCMLPHKNKHLILEPSPTWNIFAHPEKAHTVSDILPSFWRTRTTIMAGSQPMTSDDVEHIVGSVLKTMLSYIWISWKIPFRAHVNRFTLCCCFNVNTEKFIQWFWVLQQQAGDQRERNLPKYYKQWLRPS